MLPTYSRGVAQSTPHDASNQSIRVCLREFTAMARERLSHLQMLPSGRLTMSHLPHLSSTVDFRCC